MNALAVSAVAHDAHHAILSHRATGPATIGIRCPPDVGALVKDVICIEQRNEKINVEQCSHGSDAFLIHQFPDVIESNHVATAGKNRHSVFG